MVRILLILPLIISLVQGQVCNIDYSTECYLQSGYDFNGIDMFNKCYLSDGSHQCETRYQMDPCSYQDCCDFAGAIGNVASISDISMTVSSSSSQLYTVSDFARDVFVYPTPWFFDQCLQFNTYSIHADDDDGQFDSRVQLQSVTFSSTDCSVDPCVTTTVPNRNIYYDVDPLDADWSYTQVYLQIDFSDPTDLSKDYRYISPYFTIEVNCPPSGLLTLSSSSSVFQYITGNPLTFTFTPGAIVCSTATLGTLTYSVEVDPSGSNSKTIDQSSFTQHDDGSYSIQFDDFFSQYYMYLKVKATDGTNTFYTSSQFQIITCSSSSTTLSMLPDSPDPTVGFNYVQSISLQPVSSGNSIYFVYTDWVNSLIEAHPTADCITTLRIASTQNTDLNDPIAVPDLNPVHEVLADGTVRIEFIGDETVPNVLPFYLIGQAEGGSEVVSPQMTLIVECTADSNTVSHPDGALTFNFEDVTGSFSFYMSKFTESWAAGCPVDSYTVKDDIVTYKKDQYGNIIDQIDGYTDYIYEVLDFGGQIKMSTKTYCVNEMHHIFIIQAWMGSIMVAETATITLHSSLNVTIPTVSPINQYANITGAYVHSIDQFVFNSPWCVLDLRISDLTTQTFDINGTSIESVQDLVDDIVISSDSSLIDIQFPNHCNHKMLYTFKVSLYREAEIVMLEHTTEELSVETTNSIDFNWDMEFPIILEFEAGQIDEWELDLNQYFMSTNPQCLIEGFRVSHSHESGSDSFLSEEEIMDLLEIDDLGTLSLVDLESSRQELMIYVQANNSAVWSYLEQPLIILTITQPEPYYEPIVVTISPMFEQDLEDQSFFGYSLDDHPPFTYQLPVIIDDSPSTIQVLFENGSDSIISSISEDFTLTFVGFEGEHILDIKLLDEEEKSNLYQMRVTFEYEIEETEEQQDDQEAQEGVSTSEKKTMETKKQAVSTFQFTGWDQVETKDVEEVEEDGEVRLPIKIELQEFSKNGLLILAYSELLEPIEYFQEQGLNLTTLNANKEQFISLEYTCFGQEDNEDSKDLVSTIPRLLSWEVVNFTESHVSLKLNFSNPLYVSSYGLKDKMQIRFLGNRIFVAKTDKLMLKANYTLHRVDVPAQAASEEDFMTVQSLGTGASSSMLVTLIIPFCFMVFMSASMNRVWAMYNMMQILSNFLNYLTLSIPANADFILNVVKNISFFSMLSEKNVQNFLETKVFKKMETLQSIIVGQGTLVTGLIFLSTGIVIVTIGLKLKLAKKFFQMMKDKLMWSSVLRAQIQTYFPTVLATLSMMRGLYGRVMNYVEEDDETSQRRNLSVEAIYVAVEQNFENVFMAIFKLLLLVSLPFFSLYFIRKNKEKLGDDSFQRKFGTLYQNLNLKSDSVYLFNTFFCLRRFCVGLPTIFKSELLIVNIYISIFSSLFMIKFLFDYKPMNSRLLNGFEIVNETFTLFITYFMFLFTDFILDVEYRYKLGYRFIAFISFIFLVNVSLVFNDMVRSSIIQGKRKKYQKRWDDYESLKSKMVNFLIWESIQSNPELPRKAEDIKVHREVLNQEFTFDQMAEKIKLIFENRSQSSEEPVFTLNPFKNMMSAQISKTVKKPETQIELKQLKIEKSITTVEEEKKAETPRWNNIEKYPLDKWRAEESISDQSFGSALSRVSADEYGAHEALVAHRQQMEKKLWKLQGDPERDAKTDQVMKRYNEIRDKIIEDQYEIEAYVEQQYYPPEERLRRFGDEIVKREELNDEFLKRKKLRRF